MSEVKRIGMATRYSEAAIHQGVVYLAGQVPEATLAEGIEAQTAEVLLMVDRLLADCGSSKLHLLRVQIFLADLADYDGMNKVWDAWVVPGYAPPRATVEARLAKPAYRVEIVVTAAQAS
jgi:enamine deaminase RidA (YjgF/YER057c/UK114 family)